MSVALQASRFSEEDIERALTVLAFFSGNANRASKELADEGLRVSSSTLTTWRAERFPDRYKRIHETLMPQIRERMAQFSEELADRAGEAELKALERFVEKVAGLSGKDASLAAKNLATARGISVDKARLLRNEPTQIREVRSADQIVRKLAAAGVFDSTAEELPQEAPAT